MQIVSSEIVHQSEANGVVFVTEKHTFADGDTHLYSYQTASGADTQLAMDLRRQNMNAAILAKEQAEAEAANFEIPITKREFRDKFSQSEQEAIDEFNATYQSSPNLTAQQKRTMQTALARHSEIDKIYMSAPTTIAVVNLFQQLGILSAERAAQVLG